MVLSRPARTHVLPAPQNPDGLTIAPIRRSAESQSATAFMPDNGQVERMNRTIKERSEEHTSELQSLMRISYAVFCLKKKKNTQRTTRRLLTASHTSDRSHENDP